MSQPPPPNGISIGSAVFAQLSHVPYTLTQTNRQTDKQTTLRATSVAIDCISRTVCRQCGLMMIIIIIIVIVIVIVIVIIIIIIIIR